MTDLGLAAQSEGVRRLRLNRPDALNALTVPAMAAPADRLEEAAADPPGAASSGERAVG